MKKLLLITPPYHAGVVESAGRWPNLGFVYLAGHARRAGYEVKIYDAMTKNHGLEEIRHEIADFRPDFVGSTSYTASFPAAMDVLRTAKEVDPSIITLMGGIHANFMYEEILRLHPYVDHVVRGEGEETLPELLDAIRDGGDLRKVLGIAFRKDGEIAVTPPRPFIHDLDSLVPAWDLVDWKDYTFFVLPKSTLGLVNSSRGCSNECSFCSQQRFWNRSYRQRSAESFVAELEHLRDHYCVNVVMLSDEYPTRDQERWNRILDLLIEREVGVSLLLETCVEDILRDAGIIDKYRRAGVLHVYLGVEATNNDRLSTFKKNIKCEQSREALRLLNDAGMITECSFVLGMPDDTWESIQETLELAKYYDPDMPHFLMIAPWPYAQIYPELESFVVDRNYANYNFVEPVVKPRNMTTDELMRAVVHCYRTYYMEKVKTYPDIGADFKRKYMLRSVRVMMNNSFLARHMQGSSGKMPEEIRQALALAEGD
mgnify:CR=1 FL=1